MGSGGWDDRSCKETDGIVRLGDLRFACMAMEVVRLVTPGVGALMT